MSHHIPEYASLAGRDSSNTIPNYSETLQDDATISLNTLCREGHRRSGGSLSIDDFALVWQGLFGRSGGMEKGVNRG